MSWGLGLVYVRELLVTKALCSSLFEKSLHKVIVSGSVWDSFQRALQRTLSAGL